MNNTVLITAYKLSLNAFYMKLYTFYCTKIHSSCIQHVILYSILHINSFHRHSTCNFILSTAHKFIPPAFYMPLHTLYCTEIHSSCIQQAFLYPQLHINSFLRHFACNYLLSTAHKFISQAFYMLLHTVYCTEIQLSCIQHGIFYSLLHINLFLVHSTCNCLLSIAHKFIPQAFYIPFHTLYCT